MCLSYTYANIHIDRQVCEDVGVGVEVENRHRCTWIEMHL